MSPIEILERQSSSLVSSVKVAESLVQEDVLDLISGKFLCLRIPNYYPAWICARLCKTLLQIPAFSRYVRAKDVGVQRTGITFFETKGDLSLLEQYYAEAKQTSSAIRKSCFPYLAPIDKLRLELEEAWSMGAHLENIHGQTMMVGIVRMFEEHFELPPHQDILARDVDEEMRLTQLQTQLSANVYLQTANHGGELEVWRESPSDHEFLTLTSDGLHLDPNKMPKPEVRIRPSAGDLILFDSGRVHAVCPSMDGSRVSMSCFIGYRGHQAPLTYWS